MDRVLLLDLNLFGEHEFGLFDRERDLEIEHLDCDDDFELLEFRDLSDSFVLDGDLDNSIGDSDFLS